MIGAAFGGVAASPTITYRKRTCCLNTNTAARLKARPADRPLAEQGAQTALFTAANETITSPERSGGRAHAHFTRPSVRTLFLPL